MSKLSRANNTLLALIIVVNSYTLVAPFFPAIVFWFKTRDHTAITQQQTEVHKPISRQQGPNQISIPSMLLNEPIHEGTDTYAELNKGVWRWPDGSTPDKGGNTVLAGHRFSYTAPRGIFYLLDKVRVGDRVGFTWNNKKYIYKVSNVQTVSASQTHVLDQTDEAQLTLYTCTPLMSPTKRLVVTAPLEEIL